MEAIDQAADLLASRWHLDGSTARMRGDRTQWQLREPRKQDRQFRKRMEETFELLAELGFAEWVVDPASFNKVGYRACKVWLDGVDTTNQSPVKMEIYNHRNRLVPKDLTYRISRADGRAIVIGEHVGTLRVTDLRTRVTYYDGTIWSERHFRGQLEVNRMANADLVSPETTALQLAKAQEEFTRLGISDIKHAMLLSENYGEMLQAKMVPYLVGMYGTVPCAISLSYAYHQTSLQMAFFIVGKDGLPSAHFGRVVITGTGMAETAEMDIGALISAKV